MPVFVEGLRPDEFVALEVGPILVEPAYPRPGESVRVRVPVHNGGPEHVAKVRVGLVTAARLVTVATLDLDSDSTVEAVLEWAEVPEGTHRVTAILDPDRLLPIEPRKRTSATLELVVSDRPGERPVQLRDLRWNEATGSIEVELHNASDVPEQVPLVVFADGEALRRTVVGPISPRESSVVAASWRRGFPPGVLRAAIAAAGTDDRGTGGVAISRDRRQDVDIRVERASIATVEASDDLPRRLTVSARVVNHGRQAMGRRCRVDLTVRPEAPAAATRHTLVIDPLGPGAAAAVSQTFDLSAEVHVATVEVVADPDDELAPPVGGKRASLEFRNPAANVDRWVSIGPTLLLEQLGAVGRLHHVAIHPTRPNRMYVASGGASGSGVWRTLDGGASWASVTDGFGTPNVKALAMDPSNPDRLYAATPGGLLRTTDGGASWLVIADGDAIELEDRAGGDQILRVDPADPSRLYLTSAGGVRRSVDGGGTWSVVLDAGRSTDLILDGSQPGRLHTAIRNDGDPARTGVYRSDDRGDTWRRLTGCPGGRLPTVTGPTTIRLASSQGTVYASFKTGTDWTLYRTTGVGCSIGGRPESVWEKGWQPDGSVGSDPIFRRLWKGIHADPTDRRFVYAGGTDLWVSSDGGDSFRRVTEPHVDHHGFAFHPADPSIIFTACDGGLYRSGAHGDTGTWQFVAKGLPNVEFYDIASAPTNPGLVIGGTQDNGTVRHDSPSTTWNWLRGGDGATVAIDPTDDSIMYSMGQYADSISRSNDGGDDWSGISASLPAGQCFNLHFQVHPAKPAIVLASCMSLWRLVQPSQTWSRILQVPSGNVLRSAVDPRSDTYYAGTSLGTVFAGVGGSSFAQILENTLGPTAVTDIEVDPDDPATIFIAFAGEGDGRVLRATRTGAGSYTSRDITGDLPADLSVRSLAVDRMNSLTVYAGTNLGVYRGRATSPTAAWDWDRYGNGLPDPDVRAVHAHPITGVLRAGTLGRGAYEVNTGPPLGSVLAVTGRVVFLRAHDLGSGFGAGTEFLDVEAVVRLDTRPGHAFGLQLRDGPNAAAAVAMLDLLRDAFRQNLAVRLEYTRTGFRSGEILRVVRPC